MTVPSGQLKSRGDWSRGQAELYLPVLKFFSEAWNAAKAGRSLAACAWKGTSAVSQGDVSCARSRPRGFALER